MMRAFRAWSLVLLPLAIGATGAAANPGHDEAHAVEPFETTQSLVGSYLAGRFARATNDASSAAEFYANALRYDPKNELLLDNAFQMEASRANWPRALKLAGELIATQPQHRIAGLALAVEDFKTGNYKGAEQRFRTASTGPIGELTSALALAWLKLAQNDAAGALATLDLPRQAEWAQLFLRYHRALIADIAGRGQEARASYEKAFGQDTRTLRTAMAYARHAAHAGDRKLAATILKNHIDKSQGEGHPLIRKLRADVLSNAPVDLVVKTPAEGMAEVFYGLGEALIAEGASGIGIVYMQMALHLDPDQQFALASLANAYESNKLYQEALDTYGRIPAGSPLEPAVEIRKAYNLNSLDKVDEARATLLKLLEKNKAAEPAADATPKPPVVPVETTIKPTDVLRLGSRGQKVVELQTALKALGYEIKSADGAFGEATMRAVSAYQGANDILADGIAGPATLRSLLGTGGAGAPDDQEQTLINERLEILDALGTIARARKLYPEAVGYYDQAIALVPKAEKRHWTYYYARGTSYERMKNWPAAEADLGKALTLYPDQPLVLNYLGYSWVDQGVNLKEGMNYIEKAVALKPDDGYIVDSLGWAHFKQGNFRDAVRYLERAVELKPDDPVLNDHLGDALWRVGREREARFQWDQALSLKPEPEDEAKIKKKISSGLEAVHTPTLDKSKQASQSDRPN